MKTANAKARSKKQICAVWAAQYGGLAGDILLPPMPCPPRPGHAWDMYGNETRLVRAARRKIGARVADVLVEPEVGDKVILTGDEHRDEE